MNKCLVNLYLSSSRTYENKTNIIFTVLQICSHLQIILVIDIIFFQHSLSPKPIHFPLYFASPIFYLEYLLTQFNDNCISNVNNTQNFKDKTQDHLTHLIDFVFETSHSHICNFDSYILPTSIIIGCILLMFVFIMFFPVSKKKSYFLLSKVIGMVIEIVYHPLLHVIFFVLTRKFLFLTTHFGEHISVESVIWLILTFSMMISGIVYMKFTQRGSSLLSYLVENNSDDIYISLLTSVIINFRVINVRIFFIYFLWTSLFLRKYYDQFVQCKYGLTCAKTKIIDFYIQSLFLSFAFVRLLTCIAFWFSSYHIKSKSEEIVMQVIELGCTFVFFIIYFIVFQYYIKRTPNPREIINSLKRDNEWGNFQILFEVFMIKFVDFFQFNLFGEKGIKDREFSQETQKKRKEIIKWFKKTYLYNIKKDHTLFIQEDEENMNDDNDSHYSKEEDSSKLPLTDEDKLLRKFQRKLFKLRNYRKELTLENKNENITGNNPTKDTKEFKKIIEISLGFRKLIKRYINRTFLINHAKNEIFLYLILVKLIFICEYDHSATRAEFFVKKYIRKKTGNQKFQILMHFLDVKFREFSIINEETFVQTIRMKTYSDQLLELVKKFQFLLEQFKLNGDSDQKRIEILEKESSSIGKCYESISKFNAMNMNKFKLNENSTYVKLKISQQLLFSPDPPDKILEETDIQFVELEYTKSNYFILHFLGQTIIIQRAPAKFLERTGYKGDEIIGQEFTYILPKCFKATTYIHLQHQITKKGKFKFEEYEFFQTKNKYIIQAKIKYIVMPIIQEDALIFAEVDFNIHNYNNCFIINQKNEIVEIGTGLYTFLGLQPQILPLSVSDVFDTEQPIQYKFSPNRHYHTVNLDEGKAIVMMNLDNYLQIYKYLIKQHSIYEEHPLFMENIHKYLDSHSIKEKKIIPVSLSSSETLNKIKVNKIENYRIFTFHFVKLSSNSGQNSHSLLGAMTLKAIGGAKSVDTFDGYCLSGGNTEMNYALGNKYTCYSTSSVSQVSTSSLNKMSAKLGSKMGRHLKNKQHFNIAQILETTYGLMMIIIVIIFAIVIRLLSYELVDQFTVLRNVRMLNTIFFNSAFIVMNKIIFNNNEHFDSFQQSIIENNEEINDFHSIFQKEIENISDSFFSQSSNVLAHMHKVFSPNIIEMNIDIPVQVIENNGNMKNTTFLNAIEIPKLNLYKLSGDKQFFVNVGFYNISNSHREEFDNIYNELELVLYQTLVNYDSILESFLKVLGNVINLFEDHYYNFQIKIYVIFSVSIFINLMSFFLYIFNSHQIKNKILKVAVVFLNLNKKDITYLSNKLTTIKKIIELEESPSNLLNKLNKEIHQKRLNIKGQKSIPVNYNSLPKSGISEERSKLSLLSSSNADLIDKINAYGDQNQNTIIKNITYNTNNATNQNKIKYNKSLSLKVYNKVVRSISIAYCLLIVYTCVVIPLLYVYMNDISMIQSFTKELAEIQIISYDYLITIQIYILTNNTELAFNNDFVEDYPSSFYEDIKIIQKYIETNEKFKVIEKYLYSLYGDDLCRNTYQNNEAYIEKIIICESLSITKSSWTNILSHIIRTTRNIFYNYHNSNRTIDDIGKYFHHKDFQELNLLLFSFINEMTAFTKDRNGMIIFQQSIDSFVSNTIIMSITLIILEVFNFILITVKILKRLKLTLHEFKLMEKFFTG